MKASLLDGNVLENFVFKKLKRLVYEVTRIDCGCYRESYLKRRFAVRMRATNTKTYWDYVRYLKANPNEYNLLLRDLTINYTEFFRDPDVFSFLKTTILPELFSSRRWVRIWSAGCASGEEPYSIAMLVHEVLKKRLKNFWITIYASDIDKDALAKAKRGTYASNGVQDVEERMLARYFSREDERYKVKDFVKRLIRFERHDLTKTPRHRNLDMILCRNVMIYFSKEAQHKIYMNLYNSLRDGGYLIAGKTEIVGGEASRKFVCVNPGSRVYKCTRTFTVEYPTKTESNAVV